MSISTKQRESPISIRIAPPSWTSPPPHALQSFFKNNSNTDLLTFSLKSICEVLLIHCLFNFPSFYFLLIRVIVLFFLSRHAIFYSLAVFNLLVSKTSCFNNCTLVPSSSVACHSSSLEFISYSNWVSLFWDAHISSRMMFIAFTKCQNWE